MVNDVYHEQRPPGVDPQLGPLFGGPLVRIAVRRKEPGEVSGYADSFLGDTEIQKCLAASGGPDRPGAYLAVVLGKKTARPRGIESINAHRDRVHREPFAGKGG